MRPKSVRPPTCLVVRVFQSFTTAVTTAGTHRTVALGSRRNASVLAWVVHFSEVTEDAASGDGSAHPSGACGVLGALSGTASVIQLDVVLLVPGVPKVRAFRGAAPPGHRERETAVVPRGPAGGEVCGRWQRRRRFGKGGDADGAEGRRGAAPAQTHRLDAHRLQAPGFPLLLQAPVGQYLEIKWKHGVNQTSIWGLNGNPV